MNRATSAPLANIHTRASAMLRSGKFNDEREFAKEMEFFRLVCLRVMGESAPEYQSICSLVFSPEAEKTPRSRHDALENLRDRLNLFIQLEEIGDVGPSPLVSSSKLQTGFVVRADNLMPAAMPDARAKIFVSYRRRDTQMIAGRVYDRLVSAFGKQNVFFDIDAIPVGVDFRQHIMSSVKQCRCMLALVGPGWTGTENSGSTGVLDQADFVRMEIELAMTLGVRVVPVLIGNAAMPAISHLPESISKFAYLNAAKVDVGVDFHAHMDRLVESLRDK